MVRLKRAYDLKATDDGLRVLVDRLWPRGLSKEKAAVDLWLKDAAPSAELRKWFDHRIDRWGEFQKRYIAELQSSQALQSLYDLSGTGPMTLLFGARDRDHNEAVVLASILERRRPGF